MLVYDLLCNEDHQFEGWFRDRKDYDRQCNSGLLRCPFCDSSEVHRIPSASYLNTGSREVAEQKSVDPVSVLRQLHQYVEENFSDVGTSFCDEARKIHDGQAEQRNIRGSATPEQILELHESGITALPLPPKPVAKEKLN